LATPSPKKGKGDGNNQKDFTPHTGDFNYFRKIPTSGKSNCGAERRFAGLPREER
jgi:hypothetical protein